MYVQLAMLPQQLEPLNKVCSCKSFIFAEDIKACISVLFVLYIDMQYYRDSSRGSSEISKSCMVTLIA